MGRQPPATLGLATLGLHDLSVGESTLLAGPSGFDQFLHQAYQPNVARLALSQVIRLSHCRRWPAGGHNFAGHKLITKAMLDNPVQSILVEARRLAIEMEVLNESGEPEETAPQRFKNWQLVTARSCCNLGLMSAPGVKVQDAGNKVELPTDDPEKAYWTIVCNCYWVWRFAIVVQREWEMFDTLLNKQAML